MFAVAFSKQRENVLAVIDCRLIFKLKKISNRVKFIYLHCYANVHYSSFVKKILKVNENNR